MADRFQVLFGDPAEAAEAAFYRLVGSLEVEENADLPGAFQLTLPIATQGASGSEDLTVVGDDRWKPYARVAVVVTPDGGSSSCIFDGYVLSHKIHVDRGTTASTLRVWGQDVSCVMNLKEVVKHWGTKKDWEIANAIFNDAYSFTPAPANRDEDAPAHPESGVGTTFNIFSSLTTGGLAGDKIEWILKRYQERFAVRDRISKTQQ